MKRFSATFMNVVRSRSVSVLVAGLLLAGFIAGGAVAPTLHRVHHAREYATAQEKAPRCTHVAHDTPSAERDATFTMSDCWVLAQNVLTTPPVPVQSSAPARHESERSAIVLALHASSVEGQSVIRGPPSSLRA